MIGQPMDLLTYSNHSSLIVSVHAIMTCLAVAACNKEYTMGKIDIKGAFSQSNEDEQDAGVHQMYGNVEVRSTGRTPR
jgi:hypothetical protein